MRPVFIFLLFLASITTPALFAGVEKVDALLKQGDALVDKHQISQALDLFKQADKLAPDRADILVRISQQSGELIESAQSKSEAQKLAETSLTDAKRAVQLDPRNAKAHLSLSIAYGRMTDFTSNRVKIEYSKFIRDEALKSLELDPSDEFAWHVVGRWHAGIAGLNPVLKFFAKLVYGGLPDASYEEAEKYLKKAEEIAPQRILHHQELAKVYIALGKLDLAKKEWQTVLTLHPADKDDKKAQIEAKEGLDSMPRN